MVDVVEPGTQRLGEDVLVGAAAVGPDAAQRQEHSQRRPDAEEIAHLHNRNVCKYYGKM